MGTAETADTALDPKTIPPAVFQKGAGGNKMYFISLLKCLYMLSVTQSTVYMISQHTQFAFNYYLAHMNSAGMQCLRTCIVLIINKYFKELRDVGP